MDSQSKSALLLEKVAQGNKTAYIELRELLLKDSGELEHLLLSAQKRDRETGSSCYEQLKYTLITIEPGFES
ncbi:hypothetical protein BGP75_22195 [Motiliproteus sp. MSK22-1]|nr:hypothetical protein BGP75_22195 [Motiliproteus sp. MSK22-1]